MTAFWKFGGFWVNVAHIIAVREMRARGDGPTKYKIILDGALGELPGEILCDGADAQELLRHLANCMPDPEPMAEQATDFSLAAPGRR